MKKKHLITFLLFLFASLLPLSIFSINLFALPPQFTDTYYGELPYMKKRLEETEGKKIVLIGNSALAFGIDVSLMQKELSNASLDYTVCPFGLYGAIGTKAMMDIALPHIGEDDIVILAPELDKQSLSMYFSGEDMWYSLEGDLSMFHSLSEDNKKEMLGSMNAYLSAKNKYYFSDEKIQTGDVYQRSSFDENCSLSVIREKNTMAGGYDRNNPISIDYSLYSQSFITYMNEYATKIKEKKANVYYSFAPMNKNGMENVNNEDSFTSSLTNDLTFRVISSLSSKIMPAGYFFDSNFHLNNTGATYYTLSLLEDIYNELGVSSKLLTEYPAEPEQDDNHDINDGDNSFENYFEYQKDGTSYRIISLNDEGRKLEKVTLPVTHEGAVITSFSKSVFSNNASIKEITIQENIRSLEDASFDGATSLEKVHLKHKDPSNIGVGWYLFQNNKNTKIYVPSSSISKYLTNYFWGYYSDRIEGE